MFGIHWDICYSELAVGVNLRVCVAVLSFCDISVMDRQPDQNAQPLTLQ